MDNTHSKMVAIDNKLKTIVANTNTCKLWCIIVIEILVLSLIFILF